MYSLIWWSVMWRPGKGQFLISVKDLLPIRPAATASQRAPYGAAPFAGFATSLGLRPPAVTNPATFSSRLTRVSHPVCRAADSMPGISMEPLNVCFFMAAGVFFGFLAMRNSVPHLDECREGLVE